MTFHTHLVKNVVRSLIDKVVNVVQQLCMRCFRLHPAASDQGHGERDGEVRRHRA